MTALPQASFSEGDNNIYREALIKLVDENIYFLRQGRCLIADMEPDNFSSLKDHSGHGSIGAHFRHCIDMYQCFFDGLPESLIDYTNRARDKSIENLCEKAERKLVEHIYRLLELRENPPADFKVNILFLTDTEDSGPVTQKIPSSILRELFTLSSHTVHHYALIAQILQANDLECPAHFGVAPSTLAYWKKNE